MVRDGGAGGAGGALAPPLLRRMTHHGSRFIQANYFKKYLAENAVNTISEPFKIFLGGMPLQTRASGARFQPPT